MDGTTEPVVAVIGNPIGGNPAQFALQRALDSLGIDWRVLSFDVATEQLGLALDGIEVLQFRGLHLDQGLARQTAAWFRDRHPDRRLDFAMVDCLFRDPDTPSTLLATDAQSEWLQLAIHQHFESRGRRIESTVWLGANELSLDLLPGDAAQFEPLKATPEPEAIEAADLIVLADGFAERTAKDARPIALESDQWPLNDASKLVIDLTADGHPELDGIAARGYVVLTREVCQVGKLLNCVARWTGRQPNADIVQDAIEEFLAI